MFSDKRLIYIVLIVAAISGIFIIYGAREVQAEHVYIRSCISEQAEFIGPRETDAGTDFTVWLMGRGSDDETFGNIYGNVLQLCGDLGFSVAEVVDKQPDIDMMGAQDLVIFCDDDVSRYTEPAWLKDFIAGGGRVILAAGLAHGNQDSSLWPVLGITEKSGRQPYNDLTFEMPLLPVQPDRAIYGSESISTRIEVDGDACVYIRDTDDEIPILYTYAYGRGGVCVINGTFLADSRSVGLLTGAVCALYEDFVYPVLGVKTVFLDNFPMNTFINDQECMRMYGCSVNSFVKDVVWSCFQGISLRTDTPYTLSIPAAAPSDEDFPAISDNLFAAMGRSGLQFGGELAYYADCTDKESLALNNELIDRFNKTFVNYTIQSLTLAGGDLSAEMQEIPGADIHFVRGNLDNRDMRFAWNENYTVFPAATEGCAIEDGNLFSIVSVLGAYGMVSHVFDINQMIAGTEDGNENKKIAAWDVYKDEVGLFESFVLDGAPWLEGRTLSQTGSDVKSYQTLDYSWSRNGSRVELDCSGMKKGQTFFFHTKDRISKAEGLTFQEAGNGYYLLRVEQSHGVITLKEG